MIRAARRVTRKVATRVTRRVLQGGDALRLRFRAYGLQGLVGAGDDIRSQDGYSSP